MITRSLSADQKRLLRLRRNVITAMLTWQLNQKAVITPVIIQPKHVPNAPQPFPSEVWVSLSQGFPMSAPWVFFPGATYNSLSDSIGNGSYWTGFSTVYYQRPVASHGVPGTSNIFNPSSSNPYGTAQEIFPWSAGGVIGDTYPLTVYNTPEINSIPPTAPKVNAYPLGLYLTNSAGGYQNYLSNSWSLDPIVIGDVTMCPNVIEASFYGYTGAPVSMITSYGGYFCGGNPLTGLFPINGSGQPQIRMYPALVGKIPETVSTTVNPAWNYNGWYYTLTIDPTGLANSATYKNGAVAQLWSYHSLVRPLIFPPKYFTSFAGYPI